MAKSCKCVVIGCNKSIDIYFFNEGYSNGKRKMKLCWCMYLTQIDSLPDLVCAFLARLRQQARVPGALEEASVPRKCSRKLSSYCHYLCIYLLLLLLTLLYVCLPIESVLTEKLSEQGACPKKTAAATASFWRRCTSEFCLSHHSLFPFLFPVVFVPFVDVTSGRRSSVFFSTPFSPPFSPLQCC